MKFAVVAALGAGVLAFGQVIIPLAEVRPGMKGYGLTVVAGTEVSRFEVEVVDVLDEPGDRNDFIIVRAWGPAITRSGGVAQGMSGSPIYLEGRLAGALSRAALWSVDRERPLALVTPIEPMLKVLDEVAQGVAESEVEEALAGTLWAEVLSSPVVASGLSSRALSLLQDGVDLQESWHPVVDLLPSWRTRNPGLLALGVPRVLAVPSASGRTATLPLGPGAPVGVGLAAGDVTVGALGTVTLIRGDAVLAFGHPFLFSGSSRYFLTEAFVFDTVAALDISYKFGTLGAVRGGVFADRWAGVAGVVGNTPAGIRTRFRARDLGRAAAQELNVRLVDEPRLAALLLYVSGLEAVDQSLDRIGPGTAIVRYTISGLGLPRPLTRENVFLSTEDIARWVPWEAALVTDVLLYNEFGDPRLTSVTMDVTVRPDLVAAEVLDLATERDTYAPGEMVRFTVTMRTWRGREERWEGLLQIPKDLETPYLELRAYGGPRRREKGESPAVFASLQDLVEFIEGIPTYNTLTVELFARDPVSDLIGETWLYGVGEVSQRIFGTVVYGRVGLILSLKGG